MSVSLNQSLYSTADALATHTRCIEIAGQNMANVQNPDYAARKIRISASSFQNGGSSLEASISTERDTLLDQQIILSIMKMSGFQSADQMNHSLENLLGERFQTNPSGTSEKTTDFGSTGLSNDINQFFTAAHDLSANPQNYTSKVTLLQKAGNIVDQLHNLDSRLTRVDSDLKLNLDQSVNKTNTLLTQIADFNDRILQYELPRPGEVALELREGRQKALEDLAQYINFETRQNGTSFQIVTKDSSSQDVVLVNSQTAKQLNYDNSTGSIKTGTTTLSVTGGSLKGLLETKTQTVPLVRQELNKWTKAFVENVNTSYNPTRATTPDPNEDFFDNTGITIDTIALKVNASTLKTSSDSSTPYANDRIKKLAELAETSISTLNNRTFAQGYSDFISKLADGFNATTQKYTDENVVQKLLLQQRQNTIGVSIDEELIYLMRSQKAFQAAAKVMTVIDELLETSINIIR